MAKVAKLTKVLHAKGAIDRLFLGDELDSSSKQPYFGHLEVRRGENNPALPNEEDL